MTNLNNKSIFIFFPKKQKSIMISYETKKSLIMTKPIIYSKKLDLKK